MDTFTAEELQPLLEQASLVYQQNFPLTTCFERAVFFSWGCTIGDCTFCYMSTQPKDKPPQETKRSIESILAEFILAKKLGWDIGFFTGGIGVFSPTETEFLLKAITKITQEKIWLSVGPLTKPLLQKYLPYIKGIVGSTETINPTLHKTVCPSKPLGPYERMFEAANEVQLQKAMTFIVGMGETKADVTILKSFIQKYNINKIHIYGLIPTKGTMFESSPVPSAEQQAWWIAQLRIAFPSLDIQAGIWEDRTDRITLLLRAGANSLSKYQAIKFFGTPSAHSIEEESKKAGRSFQGTLTKFPEINIAEIDQYPFGPSLKERIKLKLQLYLKQMQKNTAAKT